MQNALKLTLAIKILLPLNASSARLKTALPGKTKIKR